MRASCRRLRPALLGLGLALACGSAAAAQSPHTGTSGQDSCPDGGQADNPRAGDEETGDATASSVRRAQATKPSSSPRGNAAGNRATTPRWHSFLPGMFR